MTLTRLFTSESVAAGHLETATGQVSDAVLNGVLARDPQAKVAYETPIAHRALTLAGKLHTAIPGVFTALQAAIPGLAHEGLEGLGYTAVSGLDPDDPVALRAVLRIGE